MLRFAFSSWFKYLRSTLVRSAKILVPEERLRFCEARMVTLWPFMCTWGPWLHHSLNGWDLCERNNSKQICLIIWTAGTTDDEGSGHENGLRNQEPVTRDQQRYVPSLDKPTSGLLSVSQQSAYLRAQDDPRTNNKKRKSRTSRHEPRKCLHLIWFHSDAHKVTEQVKHYMFSWCHTLYRWH